MSPLRALFLYHPSRSLIGCVLLICCALSLAAQDLGQTKQPRPQVKEEAVVVRPSGEARHPITEEWDQEEGQAPLATRDWVVLMEEDCETLPSGSPLDWDIRVYGADAYWDDWSCWYDSSDESAGCADLGAEGISCDEEYPVDMNSWMVYGPFSLTDASDAELNFVFTNNSEASYDYFKVLASVDDGTFYGYQWSGEGQGPWSYSFDMTDVPTLGNICGEGEVWIAFVFQSDGSVCKTNGAQVDTIELLVNQSTTCSSDGYEPDDSYSQYTSISSGVTHNHNICPEDDQDWSRFTLSSTSEVHIWTAGDSGDTRMWLYDSGLSEIDYDDDDGDGAFSDITATLTAGTYYIKVDEYGNNDEIDSYTLSMTASTVLDLDADVEYVYINGSSVSLNGSTTVYMADLSQGLEVRLRGENDGSDTAPANASNLTLAFEQYSGSGDDSYFSIGSSTSSDLDTHTGFATLLDGSGTIGGGDQYADYWMVEGWDSGGWSSGESNNLYVDCVPRSWGDFVIHARMGLCGADWSGCSYDPSDGYPGSNPDCLGFGSYTVTVDVEPMYINVLSPASTVTVTQGETVLLGYESGAPSDGSVSLRYDLDTSWDSGNEGWIVLGMGVNGSYVHYWDTSGMAPGTYYIAGMVSQGGYLTWDYAPGTVVIQAEALDLAADVEYITVDGQTVSAGGSIDVCLADLSQTFQLRLRGENDGSDTSPAESSNLTLSFEQYTGSSDNSLFSVNASTSSDLTTHTAYQGYVDASTPLVSGDTYAEYWMLEGVDGGGWSSGESNNLYVDCSPDSWGSFVVHYRMGLCGEGWTGCSYDPSSGYPGSNPDCLGFGSYSITVNVTQMYIDMLLPSGNLSVTQGDVVSLAYEAGAPSGGSVNLRLDEDQAWDSGNESWIALAQPVNGSYYYNWNTSGVTPGTYYIAGMVTQDGFLRYDYAPATVTIEEAAADLDAEVVSLSIDGQSVNDGDTVTAWLTGPGDSFTVNLQCRNNGADSGAADYAGISVALGSFTSSAQADQVTQAGGDTDLDFHQYLGSTEIGGAGAPGGDGYADCILVESRDTNGWGSGESNTLVLQVEPDQSGYFEIHYRASVCGSGWSDCSYDPASGYPGFGETDCLGFEAYHVTVIVQTAPGDIELDPTQLEFFEDPQDASRLAPFVPAPPVPNEDWDHLSDELIVKLPASANPDYVNMTLGQEQADQLLLVAGGVKVLSPVYRGKNLPVWMRNTLRVVLMQGSNLKDLRDQLAACAGIEWVDYNYLYEVSDTPDDPRYDDQWHLAQISAAAAWDYGHGSTQLPLAIVDTGVDWDHSDLEDAVWINTGEIADNDVDDDGNGYIDDVRGWDWVDNISGAAAGEDNDGEDNDPSDFNGHGTHCAGIASAVTDNGTGVAGVSYGCPVMALRAGYENSLGRGTVVFSFAASAIEYAVDHGARVISLSFGGGSALSSPVAYAFNHGVVVCHAAGNDDISTASAIDGIPQTLSVAALDDDDQKASFSNYGSWIDISAPGVGILSTCNTGGYCSMNGTSMACPLVAGAAALLLSRNPALTPTEVMATLTSTAVDIDNLNPSYAGDLGAGRLDLAEAMASLGGTFVVRNTGAAALSISSIAPQQSWIELATTPDFPLVLQAGTEYELGVSVRWDLLASDGSGEILVLSDDPDEGSLDLEVLATLDHNAPGPPLDEDEDPSNWTHVNSFEIEWENPYDVSGIAAAWYKLGSVPGSSSDGLRVTGGDFDVEASSEGGESLYLWLEDGRGNKDHNNRVELNLYWDGTAPQAAWSYPAGGESWLSGEEVDLLWSATDSGGSGFVSQPVCVMMSLDGGSWQDLLSATENDGMQTVLVPEEAGGHELVLRLEVSDRAGNTVTQDTGPIQVDSPNLPPVVVQPLGELWLPSTRCDASIDLNAIFEDPEGAELFFSVTGYEHLIVSNEDWVVEICAPAGWLGDETITFVALDGVNGPVFEDLLVHVLAEVPPQAVVGLELVPVVESISLSWQPVTQDVNSRELLFHDGYRVYSAPFAPVPLLPEYFLLATQQTTAIDSVDWFAPDRRFYRVTAAGTGPVAPESRTAVVPENLSARDLIEASGAVIR